MCSTERRWRTAERAWNVGNCSSEFRAPPYLCRREVPGVQTRDSLPPNLTIEVARFSFPVFFENVHIPQVPHYYNTTSGAAMLLPIGIRSAFAALSTWYFAVARFQTITGSICRVVGSTRFILASNYLLHRQFVSKWLGFCQVCSCFPEWPTLPRCKRSFRV